MKTVIVDSGGANIGSVSHALDRLGRSHIVSQDGAAIAAADKVIFPGVGAAAAAMLKVRQLGLFEVMGRLEQPVLGICLGMQLLFADSEEGGSDCLGIIAGSVTKIKAEPCLPLPHMGWNRLQFIETSHPLLRDVDTAAQVYFVHSYMAPLNQTTLAYCEYGQQKIPAIVQQGNYYGCQFHPEKSAAVGQTILRNFLDL